MSFSPTKQYPLIKKIQTSTNNTKPRSRRRTVGCSHSAQRAVHVQRGLCVMQQCPRDDKKHQTNHHWDDFAARLFGLCHARRAYRKMSASERLYANATRPAVHSWQRCRWHLYMRVACTLLAGCMARAYPAHNLACMCQYHTHVIHDTANRKSTGLKQIKARVMGWRAVALYCSLYSHMPDTACDRRMHRCACPGTWSSFVRANAAPLVCPHNDADLLRSAC